MSQSISSNKTLDKPLDNKIYKVKHLVNNIVDTIYVFYGSNLPTKEQKDNIIKELVSEDEYDRYKNNKLKEGEMSVESLQRRREEELSNITYR